MKLFQNQCDFQYPWEQVTAANWNKYPNEMSTHVKAVDVLRRELKNDGNILVTERLITVKQNVPRWIMAVLGGTNLSYVREVSTVNLKDRTLKMRSCNLTYVNILKVYEMVDYTPHPDDPDNKTLFKQEARITAYGAFTRFCNSMEDWSVQRFCDNANKGKMGFDSVLKVFNGHWEQRDKYVDELGNTIVNKVNETMEDLSEMMFKENERKCTILTDYYDIFSDAFEEIK